MLRQRGEIERQKSSIFVFLNSHEFLLKTIVFLQHKNNIDSSGHHLFHWFEPFGLNQMNLGSFDDRDRGGDCESLAVGWEGGWVASSLPVSVN